MESEASFVLDPLAIELTLWGMQRAGTEYELRTIICDAIRYRKALGKGKILWCEYPIDPAALATVLRTFKCHIYSRGSNSVDVLCEWLSLFSPEYQRAIASAADWVDAAINEEKEGYGITRKLCYHIAGILLPKT